MFRLDTTKKVLILFNRYKDYMNYKERFKDIFGEDNVDYCMVKSIQAIQNIDFSNEKGVKLLIGFNLTNELYDYILTIRSNWKTENLNVLYMERRGLND